MRAMELMRNHLSILAYLAASHARNPKAEVPLQELEHELGLEGEARAAVTALVTAGLAQADLFPVNIWVQITEEGLMLLGRAGAEEAP